MEDPEVVAAIVAGDPAGLAEAYDRYATPLYSYCRSLLQEPADAADAVQDTFLVATAKLRDLRDPARLRPWLYAVARNECFRRLRAGKALSGLEEAADVPAPGTDIGAATEQAEVSQLVRAAMDGLNPRERDVIELSLVAELGGDELAAALGVSRNHAHALLSRARGQLERSLGALIVARTGRDACADLDAMLAGWDGRLTVLTRKRISRHIEQCDICGERKRRELTPALLGGVVPIAVLPAALSPGFRDQLLHVLADRSPTGMTHRLGVANRAAPFGPNGFPKPVRPPGAGPWQHVRQHPRAAVAAAAGAVVVAGAITAGIIAGSHHGPPPAATAGGPVPGVSASAGTPARGGPPGGAPGSHNGSTGSNGGGNASADGNGGNGGNGGPGLAPTSTANGGAPAPGTSRSPGPPTPVATSSSPAPTATGTVSSSPTPAPPPAPGTLALSTGTLRLVSVKGVATAKFTLTAQGGPVSYAITPGASLAGSMTVTPASGSLAAGASVTITVTSTSLIALDGQLTVNPGGHTITVVLSVSL
jgi:RNA polymerase sigma factor (sigma-70 family)